MRPALLCYVRHLRNPNIFGLGLCVVSRKLRHTQEPNLVDIIPVDIYLVAPPLLMLLLVRFAQHRSQLVSPRTQSHRYILRMQFGVVTHQHCTRITTATT